MQTLFLVSTLFCIILFCSMNIIIYNAGVESLLIEIIQFLLNFYWDDVAYYNYIGVKFYDTSSVFCIVC